jgi:enoyl-CoA hydratase/carnithine racemase
MLPICFRQGRRAIKGPSRRWMSLVRTEQTEGGITRLTMAAPPVNSLGIELITDLTAAFKQAGADPHCGGIVLASSERAFSAGLNLKELHNATPEYLDHFWENFQGD